MQNTRYSGGKSVVTSVLSKIVILLFFLFFNYAFLKTSSK